MVLVVGLVDGLVDMARGIKKHQQCIKGAISGGYWCWV